MQESELKAFIKENSSLIYEYINAEILKDIGVMSSSFFERLIYEYFSKEEKRVCTDNLTADTFGYYLITEILGESRQAFHFLEKILYVWIIFSKRQRFILIMLNLP